MLDGMRGQWLIPVAFLAVLPALAQNPAGACALDVTVVVTDGSAVPEGLAVQVVAEGGAHREAPLAPGSSTLGFEGLACGAVRVLAVGSHIGFMGAVPTAQGMSSAFLTAGVRGAVAVSIPGLQRLVVRVEDVNGVPVRDGEIFAWHVGDSSGERSRSARGSPDDSGRLSMLLERGRYQVRYRGEGQRTASEATVGGVPSTVAPVVDLADAPVEVVYRTSAAHVIVGAVRTEDGAPVARAGIDVYVGGAIRCPECARTDSLGRFEFGVEKLPVELVATDLAGRYTFDPKRVAVDEGDLGGEIVFVARDSGDRRLRGRVTADGAPVDGARVFGAPQCAENASQTSLYGFVETDGEGRFEAPCPEGCSVQLSVAPPRGSSFVATRWEGTETDCDREIEIALERGLGIRGRVRDSGRKPVEGLELALEPQWRGSSARTDAEGRFEFEGLVEGTYTLVAGRGEQGAGRVLILEDGSAPVVDVDSGAGPADLELRLVPGGEACLRIEDPEHRAVPLRWLEAHPRGGDGSPWRSRTPGAALREQPEELCVGPLPPGEFELRAGHLGESYVPMWWPGEEERRYSLAVRIKPGETARLGPMTVIAAGRIDAVLDGAAPADGLAVEFQVRVIPEPEPVEDGDEAEPAENETASETPDEKAEQPAWVAFPADRTRRSDDRVPGEPSGGPGGPMRAAIREARRARQAESNAMLTVAPPAAADDPRARFRLWAVPAGRFDLRACAGPKGCEGNQVWCTAEPVALTVDRTVQVTLEPAGEAGCPERAASAEQGEQRDPDHGDGEPSE